MAIGTVMEKAKAKSRLSQTRQTLTIRGVVPRAIKAPTAAASAPTVTVAANVPMERFSFVWADQRRRPTKRFATREAASAEARRLAALNPKIRYRVYSAVVIEEHIA